MLRSQSWSLWKGRSQMFHLRLCNPAVNHHKLSEKLEKQYGARGLLFNYLKTTQLIEHIL